MNDVECELMLDAFFDGTSVDVEVDASDYALSIDLAPIYQQDQQDQFHLTQDETPVSPALSTPSSTTTPTSPTPTPMVPTNGVVPQRCGYRTGKCQNLQAIKRNGKLHKLCEFHREKANQNQKKLDRKKRMQRYSPYDATHRSTSNSTVSSPAIAALVPRSKSSVASTTRKAPTLEASPRSIDGRASTSSAAGSSSVAAVATNPTSLHEAPLDLEYEEVAIFFSLMASDMSRGPSKASSNANAAWPETQFPPSLSFTTV